MAIPGDREGAIEAVRPWVASQADTFNRWKELPEFLEPYRDEFARAAGAYNRVEHISRHAKHKATVSARLVEKLAVVGDAGECLERLRALSGLGIHAVTVALVPGGRLERLRVMAEKLMPWI